MHHKTVYVFLCVDSIHLPLYMDQWRAPVNKLPSRLINGEFINPQRNYWLSPHSPGVLNIPFKHTTSAALPMAKPQFSHTIIKRETHAFRVI
jgi:hypothetical protein